MPAQTRFQPHGAITGIGSLPHRDPWAALQAIAQLCPEIPFWPQLPRSSPREYMIEQMLGSLSTMLVQRSQSYGYDVQNIEPFLQALHTAPAALDEQYAHGFYAFEQALRAGLFPSARAIKGQVTGPLTLAFQLFINQKSSITHPTAFQAIVQYVTRLALWQIQRLQHWSLPVLLYLDEPCLALLQQPVLDAETERAIVDVKMLIKTLQTTGALIGIHCCAALPSFTMLCDLDPDIISFDAYESIGVFYRDEAAQRWLQSGRLISFGLIPTSAKCSHLDATTLFMHWLPAEKDSQYVRMLVERSIITTTCGLGLLEEAQAQHILRLTDDVARLIQATTQGNKRVQKP